MSPGTRLVLVFLLTTAGCGSDATGVDAVLPASKQGKDLRPDEQKAFCEAVEQHFDDQLGAERKEANCRTDAVITATFFVGDVDVEQCEKNYQNCLTQPEPVETEECSIPLVWETCGATVADLEACYTHYMDATAELYLTVTCDKIAEYRDHWPGEDYVPSEACKRAEAVCPDVLPLGIADEQG